MSQTLDFGNFWHHVPAFLPHALLLKWIVIDWPSIAIFLVHATKCTLFKRRFLKIDCMWIFVFFSYFVDIFHCEFNKLFIAIAMIYIHILSARLCIWILPIELPTHLPIRCQLIKCNTFMEWNVFVSVQKQKQHYSIASQFLSHMLQSHSILIYIYFVTSSGLFHKLDLLPQCSLQQLVLWENPKK